MDDAVIQIAQALAGALRATAGCVHWHPGSRWEENLRFKTEVLAKSLLPLMDEGEYVRIGHTRYLRKGEQLIAFSGHFSYDMTKIGENADKPFGEDFLLGFLEDVPELLPKLGYWERLSEAAPVAT